MKKLLLFGLTLFCVSALFASNDELLAKAEKAAVKIIDSELHNLSKLDDFGREKDCLYSFQDDEGVENFLVTTSSMGRLEEFDYMVIFDKSYKVVSVRVLVYRSMYGGQIMNNRWLRQFEGLIPGIQLTYTEDVQAISGATFSAESITKDINRLSLLISEYHKNK